MPVWRRASSSATGTQSHHRKAGLLPGPATWLALPILVFLALPALIVIPLSFSGSADLRFPPATWSLEWYSTVFASADWRSAALRSVTVAIGTLLVATPAGVAATLAIRNAKGGWADATRIVVMMPLF